MNKFQKIMSIIFNIKESDVKDNDIKKRYHEELCIEKSSQDEYGHKTLISLDDDIKIKLKKLLLHLAIHKRKIGFNMRDEHIDVYFDENSFKNNNNQNTNGNMYAISSPGIGSNFKAFNIHLNVKIITINNSTFKNDGLYEDMVELLKDKMIKIENKIVDDTIEDMIDVSNFRRNMNLDELLGEVEPIETEEK